MTHDALSDSDQKDRFAALAKAVANDRDQLAFRQLFDHFAPRLNYWLHRRGLPNDEAEEIVQDVMTVLWHRAELYDPRRSSLSTWLFRIARNRHIDLARRAKIRQARDREPLIQIDDVPGMETLLDTDEREARVREALGRIPGEQMELVRASFFLGYTHTEIAACTGLPLGTVKSRIRLAFEHLRKALDTLKA
ncbi:sigma-70 family RNA polymerase sigma factor [Neorhizobium sp. NPDC001467]|uniref:sigma-70 family RNA polymerase sigma factor n=1 Tax=Neorhizobium sp. NPDC001467 TaxID=3390595 RepID=UPI003CFCFF1D